MFLIISVRLRGIFRGKNLTQNSRCQSVKYFNGIEENGVRGGKISEDVFSHDPGPLILSFLIPHSALRIRHFFHSHHR